MASNRSEQSDLLVFGSHVYGVYIRCNQLPVAGETVDGFQFQSPVLDDGGKGSNQAMCSARLGAKVSFCGVVGDDDAARLATIELQKNGVDVSLVRTSKTTGTGVSVAIVDSRGMSIIVTDPGANDELSISDATRIETSMSRYNYVLFQLESPLAAIMETAAKARNNGCHTVLTPGPFSPLEAGALRDIEILVPNETEALSLLESTSSNLDAEDAVKTIHEKWGVKNVVLTQGEQGCTLFWNQEIFHFDAFKVNAKNTIGAGDGFCAALCLALSRELSIDDAVRFASAVAAISVSNDSAPWTSYPSLIDVLAFLKGQGHGSQADRVASALAPGH